MSISSEFERLIEAHSAEIYAYLWRMVQDDSEAQDCLQETFMRALRAFERLSGNANHRAWLYRIATNVSLTHLKRRSREAGRQVALNANWAADAPSPADVVVRQQALQAVAEAVERLPKRQRAALVMRKYQELSYREIAAALGCSQDTARAHVYQALRKLRQELNP